MHVNNVAQKFRPSVVIPAKAGTQVCPHASGEPYNHMPLDFPLIREKAWVPAFAGMTTKGR